MSSVMDGVLVLIVLSSIVSMFQGLPSSSRGDMLSMCGLSGKGPVFEYEYYGRGEVMIGGGTVSSAESVSDPLPSTGSYSKPESDNECSPLLSSFDMIKRDNLQTADEINKDPDILPNVTLGYHLFDTCGYPTKAIDSTLRILSGDRKMGVPNYSCTEGAEVAGFVGDATFPSTLAVAELLNIYQYPQITHRVTDPLLSDRQKFPNFYRTFPSSLGWYEVVIQLLKVFGWNWVGIITSSDGTGEMELWELRKEMTRHGICIEFVVYLTNNEEINRKRVMVIEKSTTEVVILCGHFMYEYILFSKESKVLRQNITLIVNQSWNVLGYRQISLKEAFNCSVIPIYGLFYIPGLGNYMNNVHPSKRPNDPLLEDIWLYKFRCLSSNTQKNDLFLDSVGSNFTCTGPESMAYRFTKKHDGNFYFIYTAVYALAIALDDMKLHRNKDGNYGIRKRTTKTNGSRKNDQMAKEMQLHRYIRTVQLKNPFLHNVVFNDRGELPYDIMHHKMILGSVCSKDGSIGRANLISPDIFFSQVPQARCNDPCPPGSRKVQTDGIHVCCYGCVPCSDGELSNVTDSATCYKCPDDKWPDKRKMSCIPKTYDYLSYETDTMTQAFHVISILCSAATLHILTLFILLRDTPVVKANNRTVSFILLTSILLSFLCVYFFLGRPVDITCMLRQVSFGVFFSIAVSSVLAKTITVCTAFKASKPGSYWRKWVGDKLSNSVVITCSSVQVLICVIWLSVSPPYQEYDMHSYPGKIIIQCNEGSVIGFYSMLGYMGFLAAVSFVLAFMVRTLPDSFNEAKYITFSMLVFCSVWIAMIPAYLSTKGKYMVAVEVFAILASSAGILGCIFFPKCYIIIIKPERNTRKHMFARVRL
ncbi:vomeronasal type-2 receptor 26-like [Aquarana catesbeiana]|uniref:vomeronasal type-2 receptor 26-like n=1 Tax=Aquarana catesbeiana TaxID=8400 RepID=UPI003CCA5429